MAIITPLDALNESSELAPTQANFPSLMHFFKCDENGLSDTISDSIGNMVINVQFPGVLQVTGNGTRIADPTNIASGTITGSSADFTGKEVLFCVLATKAAGISIDFGGVGDAGEGGFKIVNAANTIDDGSATSAQTGNPHNGTDEMTVLWSDFSAAAAGTKLGWCDATGFTQVGEAGDGTALTFTSIGTTSFDTSSGSTLTNMYGMAVFAFDAVPPLAEVKQAMLWMRKEWLAGNKTIYPGWKNKT